MGKHKAKNKKKKLANKKDVSKKNAGKSTTNKQPTLPTETRSSEALTVFWAVSILILMTTNVLTLFGHFYVEANPDAEKMKLFGTLMLFNGALVGLISLIVLAVLHRIRIVPPPRGLTIFGVCVAVAPILTVLVQKFG